jgi:hypothetical protein
MSEQQSFVFDKFMQDLEKRGDTAKTKRARLKEQEDQWQARRLLGRYREHPLNQRVYEKPE